MQDSHAHVWQTCPAPGFQCLTSDLITGFMDRVRCYSVSPPPTAAAAFPRPRLRISAVAVLCRISRSSPPPHVPRKPYRRWTSAVSADICQPGGGNASQLHARNWEKVETAGGGGCSFRIRERFRLVPQMKYRQFAAVKRKKKKKKRRSKEKTTRKGKKKGKARQAGFAICPERTTTREEGT